MEVPEFFHRSRGEFIYGDDAGVTRSKTKPISLHSIKFNEDTRLYSFDIIISQLRKVDIIESSHPDSEATRCGETLVDINIHRDAIDGILNILDIFPY